MKKTEIESLPLDQLRPLVQRGLKLETWPGDWDAVGLILHAYRVNLEKLTNNVDIYRCLVWLGYFNGSGHDADPLVAIFRAYVTARWNEAEGEIGKESQDASPSKDDL